MEKRELFINNLKAAGGVICVACEATGISRSTYYVWYNQDPEFRERVEEVMEAQIDYVESKLMSLINSGDTTATIFYLKTKGRKRGWSDKVQQPQQPELPTVIVPALPPANLESADIKKRIKNKKDYIVKLLKQQNKYTGELSVQVTIAAQLLVRTDMLASEIFADGHSAVKIETSREGNERESISPKEKLYMELLQQSQKALRALGMNTDSRERKTDNDAFDEFIKDFKEDKE